MKKYSLLLAFLFFSITNVFSQQTDSIVLRSIFTDELVNGKGYDWLRDLTQNIGPRLSGSDNAAKAVKWAEKKMKEAGADTVYLQPVIVPHWVRGEKEQGSIIEKNGNRTDVPVIALGNSVGTKADGLTASIVEVHDMDELQKIGKEKITGKIVFYNHPFNEAFVNTFDAYGEAVVYRWAGPSEAARYGAVGTICRSMTNINDDNPHTGAMHYNDSLPKIPCFAISTNGCDLLSRILRANKETKIFLKSSCQMLDSVPSFNVIGEIRGSEFPKEIVLAGGHLDSWDNVQGAMDDGTGVMHTVEVFRIFKSLIIKPKRTVRIIAFMNEENGLRGGKTYAAEVIRKKEFHVAALESDAGGFLPMGFGCEMSAEKKAKVKSWAPLFKPYNIFEFDGDGDGADISPLKDIPHLGLSVNSQRYFDFHHSATDTFDKINKRELHLGTAAMASMIYLLSTYGL